MIVSTGKNFDVKVFLVPLDDKLTFLSNDLAEYAHSTLSYKGALNESLVQLGPSTENIVVIGLGDERKLTRDHYVRAANTAAKLLEKHKVINASFIVNTYGEIEDTLVLQGVVEGVLHANYVFDTYKTNSTNKTLAEVSFNTPLIEAEELVYSTKNVLDGVNLTRELVNLPANDLYPETLAERTIKEFEGSQVAVDVFDKADLEKLGTHALLAVSQGSAREPRMIVMKYLPLGENEPAISLVGKGVTYDSGGYAIKNARGMATMMTDMAGAAAMIGTMKALASNNIQQNVVAIIGATENLISGEAFKNGDIISTLKGTTVEVINTDAEGRLVLADILYYAATEINSKSIINTATLTGAVIAALGSNITGTFSNNQSLVEDVLDASKAVGEDMWQLPITKEFRDKIKGQRADLVNSFTAPSGGGSILAAAFLEHFVEEIPWVHLDIAGTSYTSSKGHKYLPQGASGAPVKTLYQFVKNSIEK